MDSLINDNENIVKFIISLYSTVLAICVFLIQSTIRRYVILTELETGGTFAKWPIFLCRCQHLWTFKEGIISPNASKRPEAQHRKNVSMYLSKAFLMFMSSCKNLRGSISLGEEGCHKFSLQSCFLYSFYFVLNPNKEPISEWAQGGLIPACKGVQHNPLKAFFDAVIKWEWTE